MRASCANGRGGRSARPGPTAASGVARLAPRHVAVGLFVPPPPTGQLVKELTQAAPGCLSGRAAAPPDTPPTGAAG
eukprot:218723-Alexandrium_andersonii.AAC.1